jgi:hypothetical protein
VAIDGNRIVLTVASPIAAGETVNVMYVPPLGPPPLEDLLGNDASKFTISSAPTNTAWAWAAGDRTPSASCASLSAYGSAIGSNTFRERTLPNGIKYSIGVQGEHVCIGSTD